MYIGTDSEVLVRRQTDIVANSCGTHRSSRWQAFGERWKQEAAIDNLLKHGREHDAGCRRSRCAPDTGAAEHAFDLCLPSRSSGLRDMFRQSNGRGASASGVRNRSKHAGDCCQSLLALPTCERGMEFAALPVPDPLPALWSRRAAAAAATETAASAAAPAATPLKTAARFSLYLNLLQVGDDVSVSCTPGL